MAIQPHRTASLFTPASSNLVSVGQVVRVTGYARERFNQTTLNGSNSNIVRCARREYRSMRHRLRCADRCDFAVCRCQ